MMKASSAFRSGEIQQLSDKKNEPVALLDLYLHED